MKMDLNKILFKYAVYYPVVVARMQNIPAYLKELRRTEYLPIKELEKLQLSKLKEIVKYAKHFVPFYKEKISNIGKDNIKNLRDLSEFPFVTKELLKKYPEKFFSKEPLHFLTKKTTGGSTGEPVTILKTRNAMARELAATWRGYSWAGIAIGDRQARFWGVPFGTKERLRARLIDFVTNRKRLSAFSFDQRALEHYTKALASFKPKYFYGYVSMLEEYANYLDKTQTSLTFSLHCVITTAELLTTYHRKLLEHVFATRVFNEYGCGELGSIAHECEEGSMHIVAENMIVEVLDGERVCEPDEIGELVITELNNRAMPLIRYRTGDFAALTEKSCSCGRTLPVIEKIAGRAYDMIKNPDGRFFHGEFIVYIFEECKRKHLGIGAFQVIQLDMHRLRIKIKPEAGYSMKTEELIERRFRECFDPHVSLEFEKVESIPREKSGKMRVVISMDR